jgi:HSP20 family protein
MAEKTVAAGTQNKAVTNREETRSQERYVTPPVDIYELGDALIVTADLPDISKENIDVRVENNLLTIRGKPSHSAPGEPVYREYELVNFFRQFELTQKVDQSNISAELEHGVLKLRLPKAEEAKPRKIDVRVA